MARKRSTKLSQQLRDAIDASGMSRYAICKATGIDQAAMSRFMAGRAGMTLANIDAVFQLLELDVMPKTTSSRKGR